MPQARNSTSRQYLQGRGNNAHFYSDCLLSCAPASAVKGGMCYEHAMHLPASTSTCKDGETTLGLSPGGWQVSRVAASKHHGILFGLSCLSAGAREVTVINFSFGSDQVAFLCHPPPRVSSTTKKMFAPSQASEPTK